MVKIGKYLGFGAFLFAVVALAAYYGPRILKRVDPTVAAGPYERRVETILDDDIAIRRTLLLKQLEPLEAKLKKGDALATEGRKELERISREIADLDRQRSATLQRSFTPASVVAIPLVTPRCSLQPRDNCKACPGAANMHLERQDSPTRHPVPVDVDCLSGWVYLPQGYLSGGFDILYKEKVWVQEPGRQWVLSGPTHHHDAHGRVFRFMAGTEQPGEEPKASVATVVFGGKKIKTVAKR